MKNKDIEVTVTKRNTIYSDLKPFDPGFAKENDFIEIVEWINGEGFDVCIETTQRQTFQLSWGQLEAIKHLVKKLNKL